MATPTLTKHTLAGVLGEILVDVRSAERRRAAPAVIVVHGFKGFKDWGMFPPFAERLAKAGFSAVSLNLSGSGVDDRGDFSRPERFGHNNFSAEQRDLDVVIAALDAGDLGVVRPSKLGIVGHSRGGGAAVLVTARTARIEALVTWAAIATVRRWSPVEIRAWRATGTIEVTNARTGQVLPIHLETLEDIEERAGTTLDIEAAAERVAVPWLLVHGSGDEAVPLEEADRLAARAAGNDRLERLTLDGAGHTFGAAHPFAGTPPALQRAFDTTVDFLSRSLP